MPRVGKQCLVQMIINKKGLASEKINFVPKRAWPIVLIEIGIMISITPTNKRASMNCDSKDLQWKDTMRAAA